MGLFGSKKQFPPDIGREDFADAIEGAPGPELERLRYAQAEVTRLEDYFDENIPDEEPVLAIAYCCYPTSLRVSFGAMVTTEKRITAVIGTYKNGRLVGQQDFYEFPIAHVSVETQPWGTGFLATFQVTRQSPIQLEVAHEMDWGRRFFNTVNQQITATL